jgi:hypothetical protein
MTERWRTPRSATAPSCGCEMSQSTMSPLTRPDSWRRWLIQRGAPDTRMSWYIPGSDRRMSDQVRLRCAGGQSNTATRTLPPSSSSDAREGKPSAPWTAWRRLSGASSRETRSDQNGNCSSAGSPSFVTFCHIATPPNSTVRSGS